MTNELNGRATRPIDIHADRCPATGTGWKPFEQFQNALRVQLSLLPLNFWQLVVSVNMVSVVYAVSTSACEAEGVGSTPIGHP